MDEVKLLPCPFCGGQAAFTRGQKSIGCTSCWAEGPVTTSEGIAIEWNTRPTIVTDEVVERVKRAMIKSDETWSGIQARDMSEAGSAMYERHARAAIAAMPTTDQDGGEA